MSGNCGSLFDLCMYTHVAYYGLILCLFRALVTLSKAASDPHTSQVLKSPSIELTFERKQVISIRFYLSNVYATICKW